MHASPECKRLAEGRITAAVVGWFNYVNVIIYFATTTIFVLMRMWEINDFELFIYLSTSSKWIYGKKQLYDVFSLVLSCFCPCLINFCWHRQLWKAVLDAEENAFSPLKPFFKKHLLLQAVTLPVNSITTHASTQPLSHMATHAATHTATQAASYNVLPSLTGALFCSGTPQARI